MRVEKRKGYGKQSVEWRNGGEKGGYELRETRDWLMVLACDSWSFSLEGEEGGAEQEMNY